VAVPSAAVPVTLPRLLLAVALVAAPGCGGDDPTVEEGAPAPAAAALDSRVESFLDELAEGSEVPFTGTYEVLQKLGGRRSTAVVERVPPAARITVEDLVVVTGPEAATCRRAAEACVEGVREDRLAAYGLFSGFHSTGPVEALRTIAQRPDAGPPELSEREAAGTTLRCLAVPVQGRVASTWCTAPDGVVAFVDTASLRAELVERSAPPAAGVPPPFPIVDDAAFLVEG
jgi:hypothetical protein